MATTGLKKSLVHGRVHGGYSNFCQGFATKHEAQNLLAKVSSPRSVMHAVDPGRVHWRFTLARRTRHRYHFGENMNPVSKSETLKRFREATGMGWMQAKLFFGGRSAELCARILRAHQEQAGPMYHDPIEDDSEFKVQIATARKAAEWNHRAWIADYNQKLRDSGHERHIRDWPLGSCHRIWKLKKDYLSERGISWYSPAEMNPGHRFD